MAKKFWAEDRETGKRWKGTEKEYLVMYDSGFLAVVWDAGWECSITPLDTKKWKLVKRGKE